MPPEQITLTSRKAVIDVTIADTPLSWDITEAPGMTLTVMDPGRRLSDYTPGLLGDKDSDLIATVDGRPWRVTEINHDRAAVALTLEHPGTWAMRNLRGPLEAPDGISRPAFASLLWARSRAGMKGDPLFTPLINPEATGYKPPVLKAETRKGDRDAQKVRDVQLAAGFKPGASCKIKGKEWDDEQKRVLASVLSVADDEKAPRLAELAGILAPIVETACRNLPYGDLDSEGAFQARVGMHGREVARSVEKSARIFFTKGFTGAYESAGAIKLARKFPSWSAGKIAQTCQGSKYPDRYQVHIDEARAILDAWSGGDAGGDITGAAETPDTFSLAAGEDAWTKFKALGTDSQRRAYATLDNLVFATDNQLQESRPLLTLERHGKGIKKIGQWKTDANLQVDSLPFELICTDDQAWQLAGHMVQVVGEGDANGEWLVTKLNRGSRKDRHISFEAERLRRFLPESKIAQATAAASTSRAASTRAKQQKTDGRVTKALRVIGVIDRRNLSYVYGGSSAIKGMDCSGFCSIVGNELGIVEGRLDTSRFNVWGTAGEGEIVTFWIRETGIPTKSHMYVTVKVGGKLRVAEAGGSGGPTGWRTVATGPHPRAGFKPRHASGW